MAIFPSTVFFPGEKENGSGKDGHEETKSKSKLFTVQPPSGIYKIQEFDQRSSD